MSSTGITILGKNGSTLEAISSTSNALKMDIASASHGTLAVSDSAAQSSLSTIAGAVSGSEVQVDIVSSSGTLSVSDSAAQSSLSTIATEVTSIDNKLPAVGQNAKAASVSVTLASDQGTLAVSDSTAQASLSSINSALGGSLTVSDSTAQASLSTIASEATSIDNKTPSLGQAAKSASVPVTIASDQGNLAVSMGSLSANSSSAFSSQSVSNSSTALSSAVDLQAVREVSVIGNCTETGAEIEILVSADDSAYYKRTDMSIFSDYSTGDFGKSFMVNARYLKVRYENDSGSSKTLSAVVVHKA